MIIKHFLFSNSVKKEALTQIFRKLKEGLEKLVSKENGNNPKTTPV
jgi:hypothetical protein